MWDTWSVVHAVTSRVKAILTVVALVLAFEGTAAACPFCGALDGDAGSLMNTLMVAALLFFGTRALLRRLRRGRPAASESRPSPPARPRP
jgi:hypothetical protein